MHNAIDYLWIGKKNNIWVFWRVPGPGGLLVFGGGGMPALTQIPPPVDRMTDTCKT